MTERMTQAAWAVCKNPYAMMAHIPHSLVAIGCAIIRSSVGYHARTAWPSLSDRGRWIVGVIEDRAAADYSLLAIAMAESNACAIRERVFQVGSPHIGRSLVASSNSKIHVAQAVISLAELALSPLDARLLRIVAAEVSTSINTHIDDRRYEVEEYLAALKVVSASQCDIIRRNLPDMWDN